MSFPYGRIFKSRLRPEEVSGADRDFFDKAARKKRLVPIIDEDAPVDWDDFETILREAEERAGQARGGGPGG